MFILKLTEQQGQQNPERFSIMPKIGNPIFWQNRISLLTTPETGKKFGINLSEKKDVESTTCIYFQFNFLLEFIDIFRISLPV